MRDTDVIVLCTEPRDLPHLTLGRHVVALSFLLVSSGSTSYRLTN